MLTASEVIHNIFWNRKAP